MIVVSVSMPTILKSPPHAVSSTESEEIFQEVQARTGTASGSANGFLGTPTDEGRCIRVVGIPGDRSLPDLLDGLVDQVEGHQGPFAREYGVAKAILDLELEARTRWMRRSSLPRSMSQCR